MANARKAAVEALIKINKEGAYSNIAIKAVINQYNLDSRDAAFASAVVYGVCERRLTLEYVLSCYSKIKLNKMDSAVKEIIFTALYQLIYMDKVPDSAAINESVKLCTLFNVKSASSFVNAVLRGFVRDNKNIKYPSEQEFLKYNSIKYSCPTHLIKKLRGMYGEKLCISFLQASVGSAPLEIRVNTLKTTAQQLKSILNNEGVTVTEHPFISDCLILENTGNIENLQSFKEGLFHIQDGASQLCCLALGAKPNSEAVDVCAAPGGKSFTVAQYMCNSGKLFSFDMYEHKINLINSGVQRLGITNLTADIRDATDDGSAFPVDNSADFVLCDVPCSGLGIVRRKPEIKYKPKESFCGLTEISSAILARSARLVKTGGYLMFSTCTLDRDENGVANEFLKNNNNFEPVMLNLPEGIEHVIREGEHELTLFPGIYNTDGFYFALMRRVK